MEIVIILILIGITFIGIVSGVFDGIAIADDFSRLIVRAGVPQKIAGDVSLDIQDEYDSIPDHLYAISPGRYVCRGGISLKKLRHALGTTIPDDDRTARTSGREHCLSTRGTWEADLPGPARKIPGRETAMSKTGCISLSFLQDLF